MHRSAPRLARTLACAAVPVMLVLAGCSSDSGSGSGSGSSSGSGSGSGSGTPKDTSKSAGADSSGSSLGPGKDGQGGQNVEPAKYTDLPDPCTAIAAKTINELVPAVKVKGGTAGRSTDSKSRGSCSWNGLKDNGVKGSQYRWLDVSFLRYDSEPALGVSGKQRAVDNYTKEIAKAKGTEGAKNLRSSPAVVGEVATAVGYELKRTDEDFTYATIVTRTDNVVITLTLNGTGYAGAKPPAASDLMEDAVKAATEAVASVVGRQDLSQDPSKT